MNQVTTLRRLAAWGVHLLTASTAIIGLITLMAINEEYYLTAFFLMGSAIFIDAIDGTLARHFDVKNTAPEIDGALLDNIVDFLNWVVTPCYFALSYTPLLPNGWREAVIAAVVFCSALQFSHSQAKTSDNCFYGFPCYWNFAFFYMFVYQTNPWLNLVVSAGLVILLFVPIKYVYISRMNHLLPNRLQRRAMYWFSWVFGAAGLGILLTMPTPWRLFLYITVVYLTLYFLLSLRYTLTSNH